MDHFKLFFFVKSQIENLQMDLKETKKKEQIMEKEIKKLEIVVRAGRLYKIPRKK